MECKFLFFMIDICTYCLLFRSIDWWALGIVCFELMTGWPPFFDKDFEQMSQKILMKPLRFPSKYGIKPDAQSMIRSLLERDPNVRLPCRGILTSNCADSANHEKLISGLDEFKQLHFFNSIDWYAVESRTMRPPFLPPMIGGYDDTSNFDKEFTDINLSVVSIDGVTICKPSSEEGSSSVPVNIVKPKLSPAGSGDNSEAYKGFNFFDPSFRQSYLIGNSSLLTNDDLQPSVHSMITDSHAQSY